MGQDIAFVTTVALEKGFEVVGTEVPEESWDGEIYYEVYWRQNIASWEGVVLPSGRTLVRNKPEVRAALDAAGVPWEHC